MSGFGGAAISLYGVSWWAHMSEEHGVGVRFPVEAHRRPLLIHREA